MAELRGAVVGAGRIAGLYAPVEVDAVVATHAQGMRRQGIALVAVCDADADRCHTYAEHWQVPGRYATVEHLLADQAPLDLLVVASPDSTHAAVTEAVLASPTPPRMIVLEKPPATQAIEFARLLAAAAARPAVTLLVNLSRRFDPGHTAVARLIAGRTLGEVVWLRATYYGGWMHNGIHAVDTVRLLLGSDLVVRQVRASAPGRTAADRCLDVTVQASAWPAAAIMLEGFDETHFQLFEVDVRLAGGRIRIEDFGAVIRVDRVEVNGIGERELVPQPFPTKPLDHTMMELLYEACGVALRGGCAESTLGPVLLSETAKTMKVLFDAQGYTVLS